MLSIFSGFTCAHTNVHKFERPGASSSVNVVTRSSSSGASTSAAASVPPPLKKSKIEPPRPRSDGKRESKAPEKFAPAK